MKAIFFKFSEMIFILLLISLAVYTLIGLMPGDPIDIMLAGNPHATAEDAARLRAIHGLDKPLIERYFGWLMQVLSGDLGHSRLFNQSVSSLLGSAFVNTLLLLGCAMVLSIMIALPLGVLSAIKPTGYLSRFINLICYAGISVPPFWLGLMLISIFAVSYGMFPAGGMPDGAGVSPFANWQYYILPIAALSLATIGGYTRYIRASVIETLTQDHIRTARAKGLSTTRVILHHALPQSLIPVITIIALDFGSLFSGAVITETIFNWRGMGRLVYEAIMGNDYNLALSALMVITFMILVANLIADILYRVLDPRISFGKSEA
jgi:peptide/nickel transport system permease protein